MSVPPGQPPPGPAPWGQPPPPPPPPGWGAPTPSGPTGPPAWPFVLGGVVIVVAAVAATLVFLDPFGGGDDDEMPASVPPGAVAVVGDEEITRAEFDHWYAVAEAQRAGGRGNRESVRDQTVQFLISSEWIVQEAEERGIEVGDDEVRRQYEEQKNQSFDTEADYREFLRTSGQTEDDLLFRVRLDLLTNRIREQATTDVGPPSDADVAAYYEEHRDEFEPQSLEEARETIRTRLQSEREQEALDEFVADFTERHRERTLCAEGFVTDECSNGPEPPPPSETTTPGPAPPAP